MSAQPDARPPADAPIAWETPELVLVGNLADLVQGGGKSFAGFDGDPQSDSKAVPI